MRRRTRIATITIGSFVALVAAVVVAGLPVYVFPPADEVGDADLVYVIGPPTRQRVDLAEQFLEDGTAESILISVPAGGPQGADELNACRDPRVRCEHPHTFTTKGEAQMLQEYAAELGADRTVVITFTPHVARTRYIFDQCYDGDVVVVAAEQNMSPADWAYQYVYQTAAFAKAWLKPCE